jgi:tRNA A-37 threonylcarbamoyl transferase component Bud32
VDNGSVASLSRLEDTRDTPFTLALHDAEALTCHEVVRSVPDRRLVCRGTWAGRDVYAKLFQGRHAARHARRDAEGAALLTAAGIATPALLHAGKAVDGSCEVLIFAEIDSSRDAEALWPALSPDQRKTLAVALVREVARHHRAGLLQSDLYLKNFLLQGETIYSLDGDGIRRLPRLCAARAAWRNLALLLSKFDVLELDGWLPELMSAYVSERGGQAMPLGKLSRLVEAERHRVVDGYADRKVFRNCTDVAVVHTWRTYSARMRDAELGAGALEPRTLDAAIDGDMSGRLKSGHTCTVVRATIAGRDVVVKRYNIKGWLHGFGRLLRRSRASVSWANAHRLHMHGIATARPVALVERRFGPCRSRAYFLAEHLEAPDVADWMRDKAIESIRKRQLADKLAELMYKLRLLQIAHGDMKATNIHVAGDAPVLIDLDSLRHYAGRRRFERQHVKDLERLVRNWADRPHIQRMLIEALQQRYGNDPLLKRAGIALVGNNQ